MVSIVQAVMECANRLPDKIAIAAQNEVITYKQLSEKIKIFAAELKRRGIKKGSRIVIESDHIIPFFVAFLGCHLSGMVAVPVEKNISIYRLQDILKTTKPVLIFLKNFGEDFEDFFGCETVDYKVKYPKSDAVASIISTTGTTGNPVLVTHTHRSHVSVSENCIEGINLTENSVIFTNISLVLAAGYRRTFVALCLGATAVITDKPLTEELMVDLFDKYNMTHIAIVPSNLDFFLDIKDERLLEYVGNVEAIETVSGAITSEQIHTFYKKFANGILYNTYGTTESGCLLYNDTRDTYTDNCLGKPVSNAKIKVIDENGNTVTQPGDYGYLGVKGPMNMAGYYKKKTLTEKVMPNDYMIINDIVYFDEAGYYYFVSRLGEIIDVDGHKVIPTEIERIAADFHGVIDCACRGEKGKHYGNMPVLYIVCDEATFDYEGFKAHLRKNLEDYKVPGLIVPTDKIPRTVTGKIIRKMLK